ncbi:MAG TPA: type II secretion system F family protein [Planctomycetota bacterium]|nr:type II secretion system F family protein [Planctomycetota bacterium]
MQTHVRRETPSSDKRTVAVERAGGTPAPQQRPTRFFFAGRVRQKDLTAFTRQFATLLDAGLPIVRSLDILHAPLRAGALKRCVDDVKSDVEGGSALSEALARHPMVFDKLFVNMIRAGESGGVLDEILERLAEYREKAQRLQQKIIGALLYPAAVVLIASCILSFIMIFIIPKFKEMFDEMGLKDKMPASTRLLMAMATAMSQYWYILIFTPVLMVLLFKLIVRTPRGRLIADAVKLRIPIFGLIAAKSSISRFCRTLGTLVTSGVPILDALSIIKNATGNQVVANAIETVHTSIKEGDTIADPLKHSGVFDDLVVNMIQVGEETGELDKMLLKVADTYDNDVDTLVGSLMSLLEPLLILAMGFAVGFIVIALFMPLIEVMKTLSGG